MAVKIRKRNRVLMAIRENATQLVIIGHGRWHRSYYSGKFKAPKGTKFIFYIERGGYSKTGWSEIEAIMQYPKIARKGWTGLEKHRIEVDKLVAKLNRIYTWSERRSDVERIKDLLIELSKHCDPNRLKSLTGVSLADAANYWGTNWETHLRKRYYDCYLQGRTKYINVHKTYPLPIASHKEQILGKDKIYNYTVGHVGPMGHDPRVKERFFKAAGLNIGPGDVDICMPWPDTEKRKLKEIVDATAKVKRGHYQVYHYMPCRAMPKGWQEKQTST